MKPGFDSGDDSWIALAGSDDAVARGQAAERAVRGGGPDGERAIAALLADPDPVVRFKLAVALAGQGDDRGLDALLWGMAKPDLCFAALQALTELGSPSCRPAVARFFKRRFIHPLERLQAAAVLHRCGDERGTRLLAASLEDRRPEVRGLALELWGRLAMPGALEMLSRLAADEQDGQRLDAVRGLAWLGDARALPLLRRLAAQKQDFELAEEARQALASLGEAQAAEH